MNFPNDIFLRASALALMFVVPHVSHATLRMNVQVSSIYQLGNNASVSLGHTVTAETNLNRVTAGGSFVASCVGLGSVPGQRSLTSSRPLVRNSVVVTIPERLPGTVTMPGFYSMSRGQTVDCSYDWTAFAEEATTSITIPPGYSITLGGEKESNSGNVFFQMSKPALGDGGDEVACHP
jgi:hypothetical protein